MSKKNSLALLATAALLSGCASNKPEEPSTKISEDKVISLKSGGYVRTQTFQLLATDFQVPSDMTLRVITKSDTAKMVAAQTGAFIITALFGGSTSQATFKKTDLRGTRIDSVVNPLGSHLLPEVNKTLEERLHVNNNADYRDYPITLNYSQFYLVYDELSGNSFYNLVYEASLSTSYPGEYHLSCSFTAGDYQLEQWSANGYLKVKEVVNAKLDECLARFNQESNLASLAADLEAARNKKATEKSKS